MSVNAARALGALQRALAAALKADATLAALVQGRIHDGPPKADLTPWLAFADGSAADWSSGDGAGARVTLALEAETSDADRGRALAILDAAAAVADTAPPLAGATLVLLRATAAAVTRGDGGRRWHGRLVLEGLIEG